MKVYVGPIIGRGRIEPEWFRSMLRLLRYPVLFEPGYNDALLDRARSKVATKFLEETDADVLLQVDSDVAFDAGQAMEICDQAMDPAYSLVGGVYVTRDKTLCFPASGFLNGKRIKFEEDPTPVPVRYLGGGFAAIHRRVFEALAKRADCPLLHPKDLRFRPFYMPMIGTSQEGEPIYLSEDWAVCERAAQEGFQSFVNPSVRLNHFGVRGYRLEDMLTDEIPTQAVWLTREAGGNYIREAAQDPVSASR